MAHFMELHSLGALPTRHELSNSKTAVGTAAEATIRMPASTGLAPLHFWVDSTESGVRLTIKDTLPIGLYFEGKEFRTISMHWGSEVFIGNTRVVFLSGSLPVTSKGTKLLLTAAAVLGLAGIGMYKYQGWAAIVEPALEPPTLTSTSRSTCTYVVPSDADHAAFENERAALAKQQRFPFDPRDGVEAIEDLSQSEACYRVAGRVDEASRIHATVERWSDYVSGEYTTVRLRLKFDLEHNKYADAIMQIDAVRAFLPPHGAGPYYQWLTQTRDLLAFRLVSLRQ